MISQLPDEAWERYDRYNAAVVEEFFSGAHANRPVYLDLEADALRRIAARAGDPPAAAQDAFTKAVATTLIAVPGYQMFGRFRQRRLTWRLGDKSQAPPIVAVLALLSLVAESMRNDGVLAANAYYARFIQAIGGEPGDEALLKSVRDGHRRDVVAMWQEFNGWLAADPTRGIPTAYAFDHRTYIGIALSQALVREADRASLAGVFTAARLVPGQDLARDDMTNLLREWLPTAPVSKSLKALSKRSGALEHIADVALAELAAWDGGEASATRTVGLRLIAQLRYRRGRKRLEMEMLARLEPGTARLVVAGHLEELELVRDGREVSGTVSDVGRILNATAVVSSVSGSVTRAPRAIVVLRLDGDRGRFEEVDRAALGAEHLLLVRSSVLDKTEAALEEVARPGWEVLSSLRGLPQDWTVIRGVEIAALGRWADAREVLVPTGWSQLSLHGGMRLPGRGRWLASRPPEISVSVLEGGEANLVLTPMPAALDEAHELVPQTLVTIEHETEAVALASLALEAGAYVVESTTGPDNRVLARAAFELVEPMSAAVGHHLGHEVSGPPDWAMSAREGALRGASVPVLADWPVLAASPLPGALEAPLELDDAEEDDPDNEFGPRFPVEAPECFETGYHHYILPRGRAPRRGWRVFCKHCDRELAILPPRAKRTEVARVRLPPRPARTAGGENDILVALSAIGTGTTSVLSRIVEQIDDQPWAASERARQLSALGHLDLRFGSDGRIAEWGIAPAVLARLKSGDLLLCGWRSEDLVTALRRATARMGGHLRQEANEESPDRLAVEKLDDDQARELAVDVERAVGVQVELSEDPALAIARRLPDISSILPLLPVCHSPEHLEWLEPAQWRWVPRHAIGTIGAYRTSRLPRMTYFYDGRSLRACPGALARWLAVSDASPPLAYDEATETLVVPLGGRLPGLWERAAVLATGRAPQKSQGRLLYSGVPAEIAQRLAASLSTRAGVITVG